MRRLLVFLYNIFGVPLLFFVALIGSLFNSKIRKGIKERKNNIKMIKDILSQVPHKRQRIWFHVSSYGEFLQLKPVLSFIKQANPDIFTIISFFSPSGYDHTPLQPAIDLKCYLPFDSYFQAKKFISIISPRVAGIVRHDIWPNFVWRLKIEKIPLILIDASLPQKSSRLLPILRGINRNLFSLMDAILAISQEEAEKFTRLVDDSEKIYTIGDTKYDQVFERSQNLDRISMLLEEPHLREKDVIVVGSSWQTDEDHLIPAFKQLSQQYKNIIIILAPHEPTPSRIEYIESQLKEAELTWTLLSKFRPGQLKSRCLIVDAVGLLANIYYLGKIAFVGGSFHYKVHNVLEPAVYGIPVLFGPKMTNSSEAQNLLKNNAAFLVNSTEQIVDVISNLIENQEVAKDYGARAKEIVMQNVGSSMKIAQFLLRYF